MEKTTVRLGEGLRAEIKVRNHTVFADEPIHDGGTDTSPTPMELMAGALGACMAITAKLYAIRKGWPLEGVEVVLDMERFLGKEYPAYNGDAAFVHEVREQIVFKGPLDEAQLERLREIAARCPVHRVVENPAFFVDQILESEGLSGD
ncbi:MAG: OsmC family protein [Anaerolineae bacterium]|nr:OsmC family protein [Anaerolineae bacterium]